MATRPFVFGLRFRDKGRTIRVRTEGRGRRSFLVEDSREGRPARRRSHPTLASALRDFAATWRGRLH
jgi:hypothetical protein